MDKANVMESGILWRETVSRLSVESFSDIKLSHLYADIYGQRHTTYSLRHSALCFQILKSGGTGLFGLAKNARTSVLMLERFYLSHLSAQLPEFTKQLRTKRVLETPS